MKAVVWLGERPKTPPLSEDARHEIGVALQRLQDGEDLMYPLSLPMPVIGPRCHELRIRDENRIWRLVYRTDMSAIVVVHLFSKTTRETPRRVIGLCRFRLRAYDAVTWRQER